jgi:hypothetical protein
LLCEFFYSIFFDFIPIKFEDLRRSNVCRTKGGFAPLKEAVSQYVKKKYPTPHDIATTQCCGSGSGAFLTPESQTHIFYKFYNSLKTGPNLFLQHFKNKIIFSFVKFVATKKGMTKLFFHPSLLLRLLDPGSGMGKKSGSGINIPDPQHC